MYMYKSVCVCVCLCVCGVRLGELSSGGGGVALEREPSSLTTRETLCMASRSAVMATTSGYPSCITGTSVLSNISKLEGGRGEGGEGSYTRKYNKRKFGCLPPTHYVGLVWELVASDSACSMVFLMLNRWTRCEEADWLLVM